MNLPIEFEKKMKAFLGNEWDDFLYSYDNNRFQALRFNTLKVQSPEEIMRILKVLGISSDKKVSWANEAYYFDENGHMQTGAVTLNGLSYLFSADGSLYTGWFNDGVTARYYEIDGHMVTGLATINGAVYYFDDAGAMQTGIVEIGGVPYLFDVDGKMITDPAVLLQLQMAAAN